MVYNENIVQGLNMRLAQTSLLLAQGLAVLEVLKTKGIITEEEIQEAAESINAKTELQDGEGAGVDTPAGADSLPEEEEVVCEGDSGECIPERTT